MSSEITDNSSVSDWLDALQEGDEDAARKIWKRYHRLLIIQARRRLKSMRVARTSADEEDVLQAVFSNVFRRIMLGKYPNLTDRDGLWKLLVKATEHRVKSQWRHSRAKRRVDDRKRQINDNSESDILKNLESQVSGTTIDELLAVASEFLGELKDERLVIARMRLEGYTQREIAQEVGRSLSSIERTLSLLRRMLEREIERER